MVVQSITEGNGRRIESIRQGQAHKIRRTNDDRGQDRRSRNGTAPLRRSSLLPVSVARSRASLSLSLSLSSDWIRVAVHTHTIQHRTTQPIDTKGASVSHERMDALLSRCVVTRLIRPPQCVPKDHPTARKQQRTHQRSNTPSRNHDTRHGFFTWDTRRAVFLVMTTRSSCGHPAGAGSDRHHTWEFE